MVDDKKWALELFQARAADYKLADEYYYGDHRLTFATDKFRAAFGSLVRAFADNLCPAVVDTIADRLQVLGFAAEGGNEAISKRAWQIWQANRMDRRSGEVHVEGLRAGDAYLIVWPEEGWGPRLYPQNGAQCVVAYDTERPGEILKAAKCWFDNAYRWRFNLYYPERIEKYASSQYSESSGVTPAMPSTASGFTEWQAPGEVWPLPNPYGQVPVFHFANNAATGGLGRSELADVIPLQDALNKAVADMLVAMEFVALPQRWATGLEVEIDPGTGKPMAPFVPGVDRIWSVGSPDTAFGQFPAADLAQFITVQDSFRMEIARVARVPMHHLMPRGEYPSGEAMKTAEEPLMAKIRDRQLAWGNVWEDAMALALRMAGGESDALACTWLEPTPRNTQTFLGALLLKEQIGISKKQLQREAGYSETEIAAMAAEKAEEAGSLGEQLLTAFDRGQDGAT